MTHPTVFTTATLPLLSSISGSPLRRGFLVATLAFALTWFAPSQTAQALLPPPAPDGGYVGFNTAESDFALENLINGNSNTAIGNGALPTDTAGSLNTATGYGALQFNQTGMQNTATGVNALNANSADNNTAMGYTAYGGVATLLRN